MLRHCTLDELLALRDGAGTGNARAHVAECTACRTELERLYQRRAALKALPSLNPPRDRWPAVRAAYVAGRRGTWWRRAALGALAAAAALAVAVGVGRVNSATTGTAVARPDLETLVLESQRLEQVLLNVALERRVMDGLTALIIAALEDRLAALDLAITVARADDGDRGAMLALWRERVALMDALVTSHVRPVASVGF